MSHFYGRLQGNKGEATRCGTKASGLRVDAASWKGAICVKVWHEDETGEDWYRIERIPWQGTGAAEVI